jgi:arylsulfatase A-like enzyme
MPRPHKTILAVLAAVDTSYSGDNGDWQDVYPDAGYTPFRGTKGTVREGGNRVPAIAWMPEKSCRTRTGRASL